MNIFGLMWCIVPEHGGQTRHSGRKHLKNSGSSGWSRLGVIGLPIGVSWLKMCVRDRETCCSYQHVSASSPSCHSSLISLCREPWFWCLHGGFVLLHMPTSITCPSATPALLAGGKKSVEKCRPLCSGS